MVDTSQGILWKVLKISSIGFHILAVPRYRLDPQAPVDICVIGLRFRVLGLGYCHDPQALGSSVEGLGYCHDSQALGSSVEGLGYCQDPHAPVANILSMTSSVLHMILLFPHKG